MLGVGTGDLRPLRQADLFATGPGKDSRLDAAIDGIRDRFGSAVLTRASLLPRRPRLGSAPRLSLVSSLPAMYISFFGLIEKPFAITPDPRYLYLSERHAEALAHLLYGINESGGFIQLTGEVGTGKTTVVRTLLSRVPQHADVAVILNPRVTPVEFLLTICEELGLGLDEADRNSVKEMVDALNRRLLAAHAEGRRVIVIVDEAQNLSAEVLEQVRLLTNLETATQKLLQIILIGQPELRELLDRTELRQLAQRITGRYHLNPLSQDGDARIRAPSAARCRSGRRDLHARGAARGASAVLRRPARHQCVLRPRAARRLHRRRRKKVTPALVRRAAGEVYGRRFVPPWLGWVAGSGRRSPGLRHRVLDLGIWRHRSRRCTPPRSPRRPLAWCRRRPARRPSRCTARSDERRAVACRRRAAVSINALLAANGANTSDAAAFRRLLSLWGTAMADDKDPCGQAQKAGLACLDQRGSWAQVRALNRPAILTLTDDQGQRHRVVLSALDDGYATLDLGEHNVRVPLDELSRDWFGEFTVVWKPKTPRTRLLSLGMRGDEVRWLRRSLNALHGAASDPELGRRLR